MSAMEVTVQQQNDVAPQSEVNDPSLYTDPVNGERNVWDAFRLADSAIDTSVENYKFLYKATRWALENAPKEIVEGWK